VVAQLLVQPVPKVNKDQLDLQDQLGPKAQLVVQMVQEVLGLKDLKVKEVFKD
jgi:hypothetical protein